MANVFDQNIIVGSSRIVGSVFADGGAVRGEGGPTHPQLVIPLSIQLNARPEESTLVLIGLRARLTTVHNAAFHKPICAPITESLIRGFPVRSLPSGGSKQDVRLRFFLTQAEVVELEGLRHARTSDVFELYLNLEPTVAAITTHNGAGSDGTWQPSIFEPSFGMYASVQPFWYASISDLAVQIELSTWVREVLPGLGLDQVRLLELTFPPALPEHPSAASQFDKARRAFDERRYEDCIKECRGLLNMWEKQYKTTRQYLVAQAVADARGWPEGDVRRDLLDKLWKEVGDVANATHHPEGDVDASVFTERDARLILLLTTALSEYVEPR